MRLGEWWWKWQEDNQDIDVEFAESMEELKEALRQLGRSIMDLFKGSS